LWILVRLSAIGQSCSVRRSVGVSRSSISGSIEILRLRTTIPESDYALAKEGSGTGLLIGCSSEGVRLVRSVPGCESGIRPCSTTKRRNSFGVMCRASRKRRLTLDRLENPVVVHSVEDVHNGDGYSSVMYIGGTVGCAKNTAYLPGQCASFLAGKTPPDFPADNFEVDFVGRCTEADLTALGKSQLGLL